MAKIDNLIRELDREFLPSVRETMLMRSDFDRIVAPYRSKPAKRPNPKRQTLRRGKQTREEIAEVRHQLFLRAKGICEAELYGHLRSPKCEVNVPEHLGEAAHIKSKARGGRFELSNLLWKCGPCHRYEHAGGKPCPPKPKGNQG